MTIYIVLISILLWTPAMADVFYSPDKTETCMEIRVKENGEQYIRECRDARKHDDLIQARWCIRTLKRSGEWSPICDWRIVEYIEELLPEIKDEIRDKQGIFMNNLKCTQDEQGMFMCNPIHVEDEESKKD